MCFAGLNRKERARLLVCFILLVSAAFFWSAFEQKPTSFNLFANDYIFNRMIGDFEIPAVWFQSINALFIIPLALHQLGMAETRDEEHPPEQYHQIRDRHSGSAAAGFGLDDAGGTEMY